MLSFEPQVGKVKTGLTIDGFTVISPKRKEGYMMRYVVRKT